MEKWLFRIMAGPEGKEVKASEMGEEEKNKLENWLELQFLEALECLENETDSNQDRPEGAE